MEMGIQAGNAQMTQAELYSSDLVRFRHSQIIIVYKCGNRHPVDLIDSCDFTFRDLPFEQSANNFFLAGQFHMCGLAPDWSS